MSIVTNTKRGGGAKRGMPRISNSHHAYLIEGERARVIEELLLSLEADMGVPVRGNPDVVLLEYDSFGIDEGRAVNALEENRPLAREGKQVFVIAANSITHEAQNALLKMFEEPTPDTYFFVIMPSISRVIPTLRSRFETVRFAEAPRHSAAAEAFLNDGYAKRNKFVEKLVDSKDKARALEFLRSLEAVLHDRARHNASADIIYALGEIRLCAGYLMDTAPSLKLILGYLALAVPVMHKKEQSA